MQIRKLSFNLTYINFVLERLLTNSRQVACMWFKWWKKK